MPNFLRELMTSPAYMDKNSNEYVTAEQYLKILYPGNVITDASGRMVEPEYDMTLAEFYKVQEKLDTDLEAAIQEAKDEHMDETGEEFSDDAITDYIKLEETIDVRVLMPTRNIEVKQLEVYTFDLPEDHNNPDTPSKNKSIWRWHSEDEDSTCDECASHDGEIYENEDDIPGIPVHPNCRCWLTEEETDPSGRTISIKSYKPKVPEVKNEAEKDAKEMKMSDNGIAALKKQEGCVKQDGKHIIYNDQTGKPVPKAAPLPAGATIGYGHLIKPGEDFRGGITESTATELLRGDIAAAEHAVQDNITTPITQNQYDALVMLAYNIGATAFEKSTVVQYVNNPDTVDSKYPSLESAWGAWNKSGGRVMQGLVNRRNYELRIYNTGTY